MYHIGENGCAIGWGADRRFPNQRVKGLLNAWLTSREFKIYLAPQRIELAVPRKLKNGVVLRTVRFPVRPHGCLPITNVKPNGTFSAQWPTDKTGFRTISPDCESQAAYGPFKSGRKGGLPVGISEVDGFPPARDFVGQCVGNIFSRKCSEGGDACPT